MDIILLQDSSIPYYEQIVQQIKVQIADGRLAEGTQLPSMRLLAKELFVSVITTKRAYQELESAGYITTVSGKGCFVARPGPDEFRRETIQRLQELMRKAAALARCADIGMEELYQMITDSYREDEQ